MTTPDIFLSHNREDQVVAKWFAEGLNVWNATPLEGGE